MPTQPCKPKNTAAMNHRIVLAAALLTERDAKRMARIVDQVDELSLELLDRLTDAGRVLADGLVDCPVEAQATRCVVEPLHRESVDLAQLLRRIKTRLAAAMPRTPDELHASISQQFSDCAGNGQHDHLVDGNTPKALACILSSAYDALSGSAMAFDVAIQSEQERKTRNGGLATRGEDLLDILRTAVKKNSAAIEAIRRWRRKQAEQGAGL